MFDSSRKMLRRLSLGGLADQIEQASKQVREVETKRAVEKREAMTTTKLSRVKKHAYMIEVEADPIAIVSIL
jgi:hypothetical protein